MSATTLIPVSKAIARVGRKLNYSRSHVAKAVRENRSALSVKRTRGKWMIPWTAEPKLERIIKQTSGPRYKLGEKGPNA